MSRVRLHGQNPVDGTRSLLDGNRTQPKTIQFITGELSRETKALAVVVHHQKQPAVILRKFYHDMASLSMLFYVVECFPVNLEKLPTNAVGSAQIRRIHEEIEGQIGLVSEAFGEAPHEVYEVGRLHPHRLQVGHEMPQFG